MPAEVWRNSDLFNLLRSLYTAKTAAVGTRDNGHGEPGPAVEASQLYQQGCQMAVQTLLLALGYLPRDFYQAEPDETTRRGHGREIWMRADLANLIASIHNAFASSTGWLPQIQADPAWTMRYAGFFDMLARVLEALGLPAQVLERDSRPAPPFLPRHWVEEDADED